MVPSGIVLLRYFEFNFLDKESGYSFLNGLHFSDVAVVSHAPIFFRPDSHQHTQVAVTPNAVCFPSPAHYAGSFILVHLS